MSTNSMGLPELGSMIEVLASSEPCPMISTEWSLMMPFTSSHVAAAAVPENTQHRRDDRSDYRPRTMLHSIAKAVTRLCVSQSIDVRKLIAGW